MKVTLKITLTNCVRKWSVSKGLKLTERQISKVVDSINRNGFGVDTITFKKNVN